MEVVVVIILMIVVGGAISAAFASNEGREVAQKFANLGVLRGKTKQEIIDAVGEQPNAMSVIGPGKTLLQWQKANYHIALAFDGEICDGVTHEHLG
jgi:hypothetical protein